MTKGTVGIIYEGLLHLILAKYGGSNNLPRIRSFDCYQSPITPTLFLLKTMGQGQLKSALDNFLHEPAPLETIWLYEAQTLPNLNNQTSMKLLQKLFANNITTITQITLPNGTHLMNEENYKNSYSAPTRLVKCALNLAKQLFCHSECSNTCPHPCITQHNPYTLKVEYISANGTTHTPIIILHTLDPQETTTTSFPKPPPHILKSHTQYPIQAILQHKHHTHKDNQKVRKPHFIPMSLDYPRHHLQTMATTTSPLPTTRPQYY